jgi:hypothetical protein
MIRISALGLGVAVLGAVALGYCFRWWVGERPADTPPRIAQQNEFEEPIGYPNAYHVTPLPDA